MATKKAAVKFTRWSPSRLADYDQCPLMAKLKHLDRLCPRCFKGRVQGGYDDTPAVCDTCGETITKSEAMERGTRVGNELDLYLKGEAKVPPIEIRHPEILRLAKEMRGEVKAKRAFVQYNVLVDRALKPVEKGWDPSAYLQTKLDLIHKKGKSGKVIDWKTGGIDKRDGSVRPDSKYDDQLFIYSVIAMTLDPLMATVSSMLAFVDTGPRHDPYVLVERATFNRVALPAKQKELHKLALPMLRDEVFAPTPSPRCRFCDFAKARGGPCRY